jgi:hypothetical protein
MPNPASSLTSVFIGEIQSRRATYSILYDFDAMCLSGEAAVVIYEIDHFKQEVTLPYGMSSPG